MIDRRELSCQQRRTMFKYCLSIVLFLGCIVTSRGRLKDDVRILKLEMDIIQLKVSAITENMSKFRDASNASCCVCPSEEKLNGTSLVNLCAASTNALTSEHAEQSIPMSAMSQGRLTSLIKGFVDIKKAVKVDLNQFEERLNSLSDQVRHFSVQALLEELETRIKDLRPPKDGDRVNRVEQQLDQCMNNFEHLEERVHVIEKTNRDILKLLDNNRPVRSQSCNCNINLVTRAEWGGRASKACSNMITPVGVVFIHHTTSSQCYTQEACSEEMRMLQNEHMDRKGWLDIGESFLVGEDGRVYEARSWDRIGAHTYGWNSKAIAISVIGEFTTRLPNSLALEAVKNTIQCGISLGKVRPDYKLYGHRDVGATDCPGDSLYAEIRTWPHYDHTAP